MNASQAAAILGVSSRAVYDLAAPAGPIPCTRIGRRVVFDEADILEFKHACRSTATANVVRSSLSSTASSPAPAVSGLASAFQAQADAYDRQESARLYALATGIEGADALIEEAVTRYVAERVPT